MRELKFRVWDEDHREFLGNEADILLDQMGGLWEWNIAHEDAPHPIECKTYIEQFTGIKDKNGKKIYENDLVNAEFIYKNGEKDYFYNFLITYHENESSFFYDGDLGESIPLMQISKQYDLEVVGNIHENGDLLK